MTNPPNTTNTIPQDLFDTGRIADVIKAIKKFSGQEDLALIPVNIKVNALCQALGLTPDEFDTMIVSNPPVLRTVKGHVFETYFDTLIKKAGLSIQEIGGDSSIDRIINGKTLQLKTPTLSGTKGVKVQYKTHKTHGAKSEVESMDYYHSYDSFSDYLIGLVSYDPLKIMVLSKDELPKHPKSPLHILSPFTIEWNNHAACNNFSRLGLEENTLLSVSDTLDPKANEELPKISKFLNVSTSVIVDTILKEENFRIWDMAIRGFAREVAFSKACKALGINVAASSSAGRLRSDKADGAVKNSQGKWVTLQVKGVSTNNCKFVGEGTIIATETQLTRGRVNDHPTQSRLYLKTDFDFLIIGLDPAMTYECRKQSGLKTPQMVWEFYCIPTMNLKEHKTYVNRLNHLQKFKYTDMQAYILNSAVFNDAI